MSNNERRIEQQFQTSHVGQLAQRHEQLKESRETQASIPAQDSTRNSNGGNHNANQSSN